MGYSHAPAGAQNGSRPGCSQNRSVGRAPAAQQVASRGALLGADFSILGSKITILAGLYSAYRCFITIYNKLKY